MSDVKPVAWLISGVDARNGNPWRTASLHNAAADYRACEDLRDVTVGLLYSQETIDALQAEIEAMQIVCAEAYQAVGSMASDLGVFETSIEVSNLLDNLSECRLVHESVLPFPSFENPLNELDKENDRLVAAFVVVHDYIAKADDALNAAIAKEKQQENLK